jgi:hypothetical protein
VRCPRTYVGAAPRPRLAVSFTAITIGFFALGGVARIALTIPTRHPRDSRARMACNGPSVPSTKGPTMQAKSRSALAVWVALMAVVASCGGSSSPHVADPDSHDAGARADATIARNACGGVGAVVYDGGAAGPADPCGPCLDGPVRGSLMYAERARS